jgi:hypothetical protein
VTTNLPQRQMWPGEAGGAGSAPGRAQLCEGGRKKGEREGGREGDALLCNPPAAPDGWHGRGHGGVSGALKGSHVTG